MGPRTSGSCRQGSLTLTSTVVAGNDAAAIISDGRFAEGAAIFAGYSGFGPAGGTNALAFEDSDVAGNSAILSSDFPRFFGGQFQDLVRTLAVSWPAPAYQARRSRARW
jgi:hypothetical protein